METTYQIVMLLIYTTGIGLYVADDSDTIDGTTAEQSGLNLAAAMFTTCGQLIMWQPGGKPLTQLPIDHPSQLSANAIAWIILLALNALSTVSAVLIAIRKFDGEIHRTPGKTARSILFVFVMCACLVTGIIT